MLFGAGCGSSAATAIDPAAPPVIRTLTVVACDTGLRVEFVGDLDPKTVTAKTFSVERASGVAAYDLAARAITYRPDDPFTSGLTYTAVLDGVASVGGTPLGTPLRWNFTCVDRTPPAVIGRVPEGDGISTLVQPSVRFSEPVDDASVTAENIYVRGVPSAPLYDATSRSVTLQLKQRLYPGRTYTVVVSRKVRDLSGNLLGVDVTWSFRTRPPADDWAVQLVDPPVPAAAACETRLSFRLGKNFRPNPDSLTTSPISIDGAPDVNVTFDSATRLLTMDPQVPLRAGRKYQLIPSGTLVDTLGDKPWDDNAQVAELQVVPTCDTPTIVSVPDAATEVLCRASMDVVFSLPMESVSTVAAITLQDLSVGDADPLKAPIVAATSKLSLDGLRATLTPSAALTNGHWYWLSVAATAQSVSGKTLTAPGGWGMTASCP